MTLLTVNLKEIGAEHDIRGDHWLPSSPHSHPPPPPIHSGDTGQMQKKTQQHSAFSQETHLSVF